MRIDSRRRLSSLESMDNFKLEGQTLQNALDRLAQINRYLGGNSITLTGIETLLKNRSLDKEISIVGYWISMSQKRFLLIF